MYLPRYLGSCCHLHKRAFDSKLNWEAHNKDKLKTCNQRLGILKPTLSRLRTANKLRTSRLIYMTLIRLRLIGYHNTVKIKREIELLAYFGHSCCHLPKFSYCSVAAAFIGYQGPYNLYS